jgi:hypothetical protein
MVDAQTSALDSVFGKASPRIAVGVSVFVAVLLAAALPLAALAHQLSGGLVYLFVFMPFTAVGALLAVRVPANPIGWIFLLVSFGVVLGVDAGAYAIRAYRVDHHGLPLSRLAVVAASGWVSFALLPLPILFFPDGRVSGRGWRRTLWVYLAVAAFLVGPVAVHALSALIDARIRVDSSGELVAGATPGFLKALGGVGLVTLALIAAAWVVRLLLRFRRSTGELRQQLKWLISGAGVCVAGFVLSIVLNNAHSEPWHAIELVAPYSIAALPLAIGVGVLKYRLYEIDRLISRTISYLVVTGLLVGVFAGVVLLTTRVLPFSSPVGVAASTLAAAALFNPVRRRVQGLVDHRFNRARYNAETVIAAFHERLRGAVDPEAVQTGLVAAVTQAIAPAHATVWVRAPAGSTADRRADPPV